MPPIEIKHGKEHGGSVKAWLFEEFLSKEECENLIQAHESHLKEFRAQKPIICFDSLDTLRKSLVSLKRDKVAESIAATEAANDKSSSTVFTERTMCLNQTFSRQLEKWGLKWSWSTSFYPGESKFSTVFGKRIEEATQLDDSHGGKYQITSYSSEVGQASRPDCRLSSGGGGGPQRYATFLVYLNDLGGDGGGETVFPEIGVDVKPREARALTWTSVDYATGDCEAKSTRKEAKVTHPVKRKHVIQRWYYLRSFAGLGKRTREADWPVRPVNTPKVTCDNAAADDDDDDDQEAVSCRMSDEWTSEHLVDHVNSADEF